MCLSCTNIIGYYISGSTGECLQCSLLYCATCPSNECQACLVGYNLCKSKGGCIPVSNLTKIEDMECYDKLRNKIMDGYLIMDC